MWVASGLTVMISGIVKLRHGSKFCLWNDNPLDYVVYFVQRIALSGCVTMFNNQTTTLSWFSQKELVLTPSTRSCSRRWTPSSFTLWCVQVTTELFLKKNVNFYLGLPGSQTWDTLIVSSLICEKVNRCQSLEVSRSMAFICIISDLLLFTMTMFVYCFCSLGCLWAWLRCLSNSYQVQ